MNSVHFENSEKIRQNLELEPRVAGGILVLTESGINIYVFFLSVLDDFLHAIPINLLTNS